MISGIRKMFYLAGPGSINFGLREPDLNLLKEAIEGMNVAAAAGRNKYGPIAGILELKGTISEYYSRYGRLKGGNIMVMSSVSTAMLEVVQSMVNPRDEVLIPSPEFVIYGPHAELAGGKAVEYRLTDDGLFQSNIDYIQSLITPKTAMIVVNTPASSMGDVFTLECKRVLCNIARDMGIIILTD